MDNGRKKYVNVERLSSGDIFALLYSIESADEGDTENIKNDSDTEFVAEDESVIYTNQCRTQSIFGGTVHLCYCKLRLVI